jgi:hypothetical protein
VFSLHNALLHEHVPINVNISLDNMWFKLRSVELLRDGRMEQQLIESYVLILVKSGVGCLTMDLHEYRLRQDAVHIALPGQTIGVSLEAAGELELYVIKFDGIAVRCVWITLARNGPTCGPKAFMPQQN